MSNSKRRLEIISRIEKEASRMALLYDEIEAWDTYCELESLSFVQRIWHVYGDRCVNLLMMIDVSIY